MSTQVEETTSATSLIDVEGKLFNGVVKWFNSKTGYGYVTVLEKDVIGQDIFVHQSEYESACKILTSTLTTMGI